MAKQGHTNEQESLPRLSNRLVLGCGALVHEMVAVLEQSPKLKAVTKLHCLPAKLHNTPQFIAAEVDAYLREFAPLYDDIFIAYGDCGTAGELDRVIAKYGATRLKGAHCYEFYSGTDQFKALSEQELGTFFLTDYLVKNFERLVIAGLGLDRYPELFDDYFKHYRKMVYLAQTKDSDLVNLAKRFADDFGWEFEHRFVGIDGLQPLVQFGIPVVVE